MNTFMRVIMHPGKNYLSGIGRRGRQKVNFWNLALMNVSYTAGDTVCAQPQELEEVFSSNMGITPIMRIL